MSGNRIPPPRPIQKTAGHLDLLREVIGGTAGQQPASTVDLARWCAGPAKIVG